MNGVLGGVIIVGGSLLLTLLVVAIVRRLVSHETLARHNDVAGFVYATMGVTYAVVLALSSSPFGRIIPAPSR
jgi:cytochrome c biogenesis factor